MPQRVKSGFFHGGAVERFRVLMVVGFLVGVDVALAVEGIAGGHETGFRGLRGKNLFSRDGEVNGVAVRLGRIEFPLEGDEIEAGEITRVVLAVDGAYLVLEVFRGYLVKIVLAAVDGTV